MTTQSFRIEANATVGSEYEEPWKCSGAPGDELPYLISTCGRAPATGGPELSPIEMLDLQPSWSYSFHRYSYFPILHFEFKLWD